MHSDPQQEASPTPGVAIDDVLYTIFRHKWLIISFTLLGIVAAGVVRVIKPPLYQSEAKISVKYVMQTTGANPSDPGTQVTALGIGGQDIMDAEVELIRSLDTALIVATNVGPARVLAEQGGGSSSLEAAAVLRGGLTVVPPRSATLALTFKHADSALVQPILDAFIKAYMRRHAEYRTGLGMDEVYSQQRDEEGKRIAQIDSDLKKLKLEAGVPDLEEAKKAYNKHISDLQQALFEAESKLTQREALYGEWMKDSTNTTTLVVPLEMADEYRNAARRVEQLKKEVREKLEEVTAFHPAVISRNEKIGELTRRLRQLEKEYPSIATFVGDTTGQAGIGTGTNEATVNISASLSDIKMLKRSVDGYSNQLALVKIEAFRLMDFERQITELERQRTAEQRNYDSIQNSLEQARQDDSKSSGRVTGMYLTQSPTPAAPDMKKLFKLIGAAFGGCVGLGFGLAFLIDMILDRTLRRRQDVIRHLHLPVFLTIPDTSWKNRVRFPWLVTNGHSKQKQQQDNGHDESEPVASNMALAAWDPTNHLQVHVEGLRERLITHFDVNSINHKPKLVALTACHDGAGVTTLASGLTASLSKTGDGSALLVDMNTAEGKTYSFYKGKPGCGPSETPEEEKEEIMNPSLALSKASPEQRRQDRLAKLLPPSFNHLVPKLKAAEYDYIVFDMPRVSPRSVTPRLSGQMDIVLMVIESERTGQQRASRAMALMREARATVVAVLNKCRDYVPARLAND